MMENIVERSSEETLRTHLGYDGVQMPFIKILLDGRYVAILKYIFTTAIVVGTIDKLQIITNRWCYTTVDDAINAYNIWEKDDPEFKTEPQFWERNPFDGRRRPGGDASKEHINP